MSQITRNFTDTEFTRSNTAIKNNINNKLPDEYTDNMMRVLNLLQVIRDSWNAPIIISSGYRCKELNKKVGGVDSSAHTIGYGVDLVSGDFRVFSNFIKSYFQSHPEIKFDQVIIEKSGKSQWIHIGLYNKEHKQRGMVFGINSQE